MTHIRRGRDSSTGPETKRMWNESMHCVQRVQNFTISWYMYGLPGRALLKISFQLCKVLKCSCIYVYIIIYMWTILSGIQIALAWTEKKELLDLLSSKKWKRQKVKIQIQRHTDRAFNDDDNKTANETHTLWLPHETQTKTWTEIETEAETAAETETETG